MAVRMTGLQSGLDTKSIIEELMSAQETKLTKIDSKRTKLKWSQEKWAELNKKLYSLYTDKLSKLRLQGSYNTKNVTSTNSSKVTASGNTAAANGTHTVQVKQLASAQNTTSGKLTTDINGETVTTKTKLTDLGFTEGNKITVTSAEGTENEKTMYLMVDENSTLNDFLTTCKNAGLNATFEATQQRMFITSKTSGKDNAFSIDAEVSGASSEYNTIKQLVGYNALSGTDKTKVDGYLKTWAKPLPEDTTSSEYYDLYLKRESAADEMSALIGANYENKVRTELLDDVKKDAKRDAQITELKELQSTGNCSFLDGVDLDNISDSDLENKIISLQNEFPSEYKTFSNAVTAAVNTAVNEAKNSTEFEDRVQAKLQTQSADIARDQAALPGLLNDFYTKMQTPGTQIGLEALGLGSNSTTVDAADAIFNYNGAELTSTSNSVTINGLTLNLTGVTDNYGQANAEQIVISISNDTEGAYKMVKDFITSYNEILKEMNDLYYAKSARGYEPLTNEEKDAMSDSEIELWEGKIKDSLLRRDDTLGSLSEAMKNSMAKSITVDGQKYSLSSFGIMTSTDYTEKGLLHIFGNKEDATYADKKDKLQTALSNDPDTTIKALTGVFQGMYEMMADKMKTTSVSSAMTFYNNKTMEKLSEDYDDEYEKMEDKLKEIEDRYYKQFAAMEKAMASSNSQTSYLSNLFGSGSK